jgi:hypothetical protein
MSLPWQALHALDGTAWLWGMLLGSVALMIRNGHRYLTQRAVVIKRMRRFGERFVREFEQPLTPRDRIDHPIQSRLRFAPSSARLDVLLAPKAGRRYPNLADHKKNFEYDVTRVLQLLKDQSFVGGQPYAHGRWVVVPFQLKRRSRQAGGA